jgi:hypothetical protein
MEHAWHRRHTTARLAQHQDQIANAHLGVHPRHPVAACVPSPWRRDLL